MRGEGRGKERKNQLSLTYGDMFERCVRHPCGYVEYYESKNSGKIFGLKI